MEIILIKNKWNAVRIIHGRYKWPVCNISSIIFKVLLAFSLIPSAFELRWDYKRDKQPFFSNYIANLMALRLSIVFLFIFDVEAFGKLSQAKHIMSIARRSIMGFFYSSISLITSRKTCRHWRSIVVIVVELIR